MLIFNGTGYCPEFLTDADTEAHSIRTRVVVTTNGGVAQLLDGQGRRVEHLAKVVVSGKGKDGIVLEGISGQLINEVLAPRTDPAHARVKWTFTDVEILHGEL